MAASIAVEAESGTISVWRSGAQGYRSGCHQGSPGVRSGESLHHPSGPTADAQPRLTFRQANA